MALVVEVVVTLVDRSVAPSEGDVNKVDGVGDEVDNEESEGSDEDGLEEVEVVTLGSMTVESNRSRGDVTN